MPVPYLFQVTHRYSTTDLVTCHVSYQQLVYEGRAMPSQQFLNPDSMSRTRGYTQAVKVDNTVYIAGQVAVAQDGVVFGNGDPETQVRQIWRNMEAAVRSVAGTLQYIVKTTTQDPALQDVQERVTAAPITVPTLALHGNRDRPRRLDAFQDMDRFFTGRLEKVVIQGTSHFLHQEKPQ